jgi:hypothetical protein
VEEWPYLDQDVLVSTRSRKVCMTCHWFRHHAGPECIPLLTCQLHQGLLAQGEHLTSCCQGWTDDLARPARLGTGGGMSPGASRWPPLSPREGWLSDGRQVLCFRPTR